MIFDNYIKSKDGAHIKTCIISVEKQLRYKKLRMMQEIRREITLRKKMLIHGVIIYVF